MALDIEVLTRNAGVLVEGMQTTLQLTFLALVLGLMWGTLLTLARLAPGRALPLAAATYVNGIRAVPLIMVIFWIYFLLPVLTGSQIGAFKSALLAFILFEGAYFSEILRSGIKSIPSGQLQAALSTGMTYLQSMRYVVLPQALRKTTPVLLTQAIALFQDTSLVYAVGLMDFMTASTMIASRDGRLIEVYSLSALVYLVFSVLAMLAVQRLDLKLGKSR
jgi:glutamate/aspartate transport system permease protein